MSSSDDTPAHSQSSMLAHLPSSRGGLETMSGHDYSAMLAKQPPPSSWPTDYTFPTQATTLDMPTLALFDAAEQTPDFQIPSPPAYSTASGPSTTLTLGTLEDPEGASYSSLFPYPQVQPRAYGTSPTPRASFTPTAPQSLSRRDSQSQLHRRSFTASPHLQPMGVPVTPSSLAESQTSSTPGNKRRRADSDSLESAPNKSGTPGASTQPPGASQSQQQQTQQQLVPKDEDRFLLKLKDEEKLTWKQIAERFLTDMHKTYQIPALQMRYKRLRERMRVWTDSDADALQQAHEYWETKKWDIISEKHQMLDFGTTEKWPARYCLNRWQQISAEKDRDALRADWIATAPMAHAAASMSAARRASADSYSLSQNFNPSSGPPYSGPGFW